MDRSVCDRRERKRRLLQVPVVYSPRGSRYEPQSWIFGTTLDVSTEGLRICFRGSCLLEPGTSLDLFIPGHNEQHRQQENIPVRIQARVTWIAKTEHVFAVEYMKS